MKTWSMPRCAIVAFGMEHCKRGVETHARMLFENLKEEAGFQMTLIKGSGHAKADELVLKVPNRDSLLNRTLGRLRGYNIYWEQVFFMLRLSFHLIRHRYDVIYTQEYVHLIGIGKLKKWLGWATRIVYAEGFVSLTETRVEYADVLQEVNKENYEFIRPIAERQGTRVDLVPHFFDPISDAREVLDTAVLGRLTQFTSQHKTILYVGPTELEEKNFSKLERAFRSLSPDWRMVICGEVPHERQQLLDESGERLEVCYVDHATMQRIYGLCDIFILPSLNEAFGIATLEAMGHGLPVLLHHSAHSIWLTGDEDQCVDMTQDSVISEHLNSIADFEAYRVEVGQKNQRYFMENFTWEHLRDRYISLFV